MKVVVLMTCLVEPVIHRLVKGVLARSIGEPTDVLTLLVLSGLLLTVTLLTGKVNSAVCYTWITPELLPHLPSQGVIVMDNASFHKRLAIHEAIRDEGHILRFLPPYSPPLNPIEPKWA